MFFMDVRKLRTEDCQFFCSIMPQKQFKVHSVPMDCALWRPAFIGSHQLSASQARGCLTSVTVASFIK